MRTPSFIIILVIALLLAGFVGMVAYYTFVPPDLSRHPERSEGSRTNVRAYARDSSPPEADQNDIDNTIPSRPIIRSTDPMRGDAEAPIAIVEFGDFFCPACAEMEETLKNILEQYKGRVKLIWKDLPNTRLHPLAQKAAQAARCAGEQGGFGQPSASQRGGFWEYHDLLFAQQQNVGSGLVPDRGGAQGPTLQFIDLARSLNLNVAQFEDCLQTERTKDLVERDFNEAILLRVDATPYFFIGERKFSGAVDESQLKDAIDLIKS